MSCCNTDESDRALGRATRTLFFLAALGLGAFVLMNLPEVKRYIKISTM